MDEKKRPNRRLQQTARRIQKEKGVKYTEALRLAQAELDAWEANRQKRLEEES